jgi:hypothetical protein
VAAAEAGSAASCFGAVPDLLYLFSDYDHHTPSGERHGGGSALWSASVRKWDAILGDGVPSATTRGLPAAAPRFNLHVGRLHEAFVHTWCVWTGTVIVSREAAGDALHFPEDVPIYEEVECYARLARHGVAGFIDCATAVERCDRGARLTNADGLAKAETALKIIGRVWGADEQYLRLRREDYETAMDVHRTRKVRNLLAGGRRREARREFAEFFHAPPRLLYYLLTYAPARLVDFAAGRRRSPYALREHLKS